MSLQPSPAFGVLLRRYRKAAALTQEELAERAHLSAVTISALERGANHAPRKDTLALLADALELAAPARAALEAAARTRGAPSADPLPVAPVSPTPLVGRQPELALLGRHLAGEGPPLLLLAGEPGIGKSRLLMEAAQQAAAQGWCVLPGGCQRQGGQAPYAPLQEALSTYLTGLPPVRQRGTLKGAAWLVRLLPELVELAGEPAGSWVLPPEQERRLVFAAVGRFVANVAGPAGTLLVLDDLQWAGADALALLISLLRASGVSGPPLRVVGAYRDSEVAPADPLAVTLADLAHTGLVRQHPLGPLAPVEAAKLVTVLLADLLHEGAQAASTAPALREQVVQRTGGVPFFLVSCVQGLYAGRGESATDAVVPWDVAQGIRQRVAALPGGAQQVLGLAAVVGRHIPPVLLSQVTACPEEEVLAVLEAARHARLLVEGDHATYLFTHDLIREVIEADLGAARRAMWHRRVAEALEQTLGALPVEELAYHYSRSADQAKAVLYVEQAGDHAALRHANEMAAGYYRDLVDRLDRLGRTHDGARAREKLGGVLATVTHYDEALALLEHAAAVYRAAGDDQGELRTLARIGRAHAWRGTPAEGIGRLVPVLEAHDADTPSPALALVCVALARLFFYAGRYADELATAERAANLAGVLGETRILAEAEQRRGVALMMLGRMDEALRALEEAIPQAEAVGDLFVLGRALVAAGAIYLERGDAATALAYRERAVAVAERLGDPAEIAFMRALLGWTLFYRGAWAQARDQCERGLAVLASSGAVLAAAYPLHVLGVLCLAEGDEEAAGRHLDQCAALAQQSGDLQALRFAHRGLAVRDVLAGQADAARARLEPLLERPGLEEDLVTDLLPVLAWADLERGDGKRAGTMAREALRRATTSGDRIMVAAARRVEGMVAARQEHWEEAQQAFAEALGLAQAMGYPYEEGRALYAWGVMLRGKATAEGRRRDTWSQAQDKLEAALAIFRRLGARRDVRLTERALQCLPDEPQPL